MKDKIQQIKDLFATCQSKEERYRKIIELGRTSKPLEPEYMIEENLVSGCQSVMYLHTEFKDGKIYFESQSEALISSGLAYLLTFVYSGETPKTILQCPPDYLLEFDIASTFSPNRANGLYSIHLRMKQEALKFLVAC